MYILVLTLMKALWVIHVMYINVLHTTIPKSFVLISHRGTCVVTAMAAARHTDAQAFHLFGKVQDYGHLSLTENSDVLFPASVLYSCYYAIKFSFSVFTLREFISISCLLTSFHQSIQYKHI